MKVDFPGAEIMDLCKQMRLLEGSRRRSSLTQITQDLHTVLCAQHTILVVVVVGQLQLMLKHVFCLFKPRPKLHTHLH